MADHRETYKGRQIVIGGTPDKPELSIDGKQIFILRNASGAYLASGFAFDPQPSVADLARKIIDYQQTTQR
jgi:hypothetical protein